MNKKELRKIYGEPSERAKRKVLYSLDKHALNFIIHSPFLTISSANKHNNHDTSPKGGKPGFAKVLNSKQLLIPDASGNNRIDGLINICENPSISLLFLIPGIDETLRINGKAIISNNEEHLIHFTKTEKESKLVL